MWKRDVRNAGRLSARIGIGVGVALAALLALGLALLGETPAQAGWCEGQNPRDYEWLRTHAARQQDGRCDDGDVCRELCLVNQCDSSVDPTGQFNCFDS